MVLCVYIFFTPINVRLILQKKNQEKVYMFSSDNKQFTYAYIFIRTHNIIQFCELCMLYQNKYKKKNK